MVITQCSKTTMQETYRKSLINKSYNIRRIENHNSGRAFIGVIFDDLLYTVSRYCEDTAPLLLDKRQV